MHEHAITNEVVHQILHACEDSGLNPKRILIELGLLSGFKKEPINLYFEEIKKEHEILKNASLHIEEVHGKIRCSDCGQLSFTDEPVPLYHCPLCSSTSVKIIAGKDIIIREIIG